MAQDKEELSKSEMEVDHPIDSGSASPVKKSSKPDETGYSPFPDMKIAQSIHRVAMMTGSIPKLDPLAAASIGLSPECIVNIFRDVAGPDVENPSLYRYLKHVVDASESSMQASWILLSDDDLTDMEAKHRSTVASLEAKIEQAKENSGDSEVLDARFELARFAAKSLTKAEALDAYDKILKTPKLSNGKSMDALMESARVACFYGDFLKGEEFIVKVSYVDCNQFVSVL